MKKLLMFLLIPYSLLLTPAPCGAQYTILHQFNDTNGQGPRGNLTLVGHRFFGVTGYGGAYDSGTIFSIDTNGSNFQDLFDFHKTIGFWPSGSLINSGNKLYGSTSFGGAYGGGAVFSIDTDGSGFINLHDFYKDTDGYEPEGSLMLSGNVLYGTTFWAPLPYYSSIFSVHTDGSNFKTLYFFTGFPNDFYDIRTSLILEGRTLYGLGSEAGTFGYGGIFSIDTSGSGYRELFYFNNTNGQWPDGSLLAVGKVLYGGTTAGGIYNEGVIFKIDTDGSNEKTLFNFKGDSNGSGPVGNLTLSGSRLFGMTGAGGGYRDGLIYSIDTDGGRYKRIFIFNDTNGAFPSGSTMIGPDLYGMTGAGGEYFSSGSGYGVIFRADTSLRDTSYIFTTSDQLSVSPEARVAMFPNPSKGIFTIAIAGAKSFSPAIIEVFNVFGQLVLKETLRGNQGDKVINLSEQPNGVYIYRISDENGGNIRNGKLVVEK